MKKKLFYLLLVGVFLVPFNVFAMSEEEATKILDKISTEKNAANNYVLNVPSLEPVALVEEGYCEISRDAFLSGCPECYEGWTDEEIDQSIEEQEEYCYSEVATAALEMYLKSIGIRFSEEFTGVRVVDNILEVSIESGKDELGTQLYTRRNYLLSWQGKTHKNQEKALKVVDGITDEYIINGWDTINSIYHYGTISENLYNHENILLRYPEFNQALSELDGFNYQLDMAGAGGFPYGTGATMYLGLFDNGVLLRIKRLNVQMDNIIFLDKKETGTVYEKAKKAISDYFGGKVEVTIDDKNADIITDFEEVDERINHYLGKKEGSYTSYAVIAKIDNREQTLLLVEIENEEYKETVKENSVTSTSAADGIMIETSSYEVPTSAVVTTNDVTENADIHKVALKKGYNFSLIYDIKLLTAIDGEPISSIKDGVTVYIPISDGKIGSKISVYYLDENYEVADTLDGEIVKVNNKLYVKFVTTHFSLYALGAADLGGTIPDSGTAVPDTGDNIIAFIVVAIVSISGIVLIKKKNLS